MKIIVAEKIYIENPPDTLRQIICADLKAENPKFIQAQKSGRWAGDIERSLFFYDIACDGDLEIPYGYGPRLSFLSEKYGVKLGFEDRTTRPALKEVAPHRFNGRYPQTRA